jgi:hypothetical protein
MDQHPLHAGGMKALDRVEISDQGSASRVRALVESAADGTSVLRLEHAARVPEVAPGVNEVCFGFETTKSTQAARIQRWSPTWLQRDHQQQSGHR